MATYKERYLAGEINHYYDSHVRVDLKAVEKLAMRLQELASFRQSNVEQDIFKNWI